MADGILFQVSGTATPAPGVTLSKMRKSKALNEYDVFAYDALHPTSWPSQSNPSSGASLINLAGTVSSTPANPATITGTATFGGGFRFAAASDGYIDLPSVCKPASTSKGYLGMFWCLVPETTSLRNIVGWHTSTSGQRAWGVYNNNVNRQYVVWSDGVSATITLSAADYNTTISGTNYALLLFCMGRAENGAGGYVGRCRVYHATRGLLDNRSGASGATAQQSTYTSARIGNHGGYGTNIVQRHYRGRFLDVGTTAGVMTTTQFDAWCLEEYNTHKGRTDWSVA